MGLLFRCSMACKGLGARGSRRLMHGPLIVLLAWSVIVSLFGGHSGLGTRGSMADAWTSYYVVCKGPGVHRLPCSGHFVLRTRVLVADTWTSYCVMRKDLGVHRLHFVGHFCLRARGSVADEWTSYCAMRKVREDGNVVNKAMFICCM
ncbi:hypothetical protein GH714_006244 [Hevea brasiliensis]|uniref:Uncharacterized protein n=1 Tax=Hevea brasiliensis TaxID=3981 RepID=A0A6A6KY73_HEVBR|nr:hypothetical protein GH714_006145 [Hevea brasiliensis]KAF2294002.1 hypothetical protein GH714_006244 [Hevea brasiliensis]